MENKKRNLEFHQTFKPERSCLANLLTDLGESSGKTAQDIAKVTGIPMGERSGKVIPTILYLKYMGLISYRLEKSKYYLEYTLLGSKIEEEDPGLVEDLSLLLIHCMLVRKNRGADLWSYIVCELLPKYHGKISKANCEKELIMYFKKETTLAPFNGTYAGLFESLGLLRNINESYAFCPHSYNEEFIYLYALVLYEYWEDWYAGFSELEREQLHISNHEISSIQLADTGFRLPFGWSEQDEYQVLEKLHDKKIITLNRQMNPFMVRKLYDKEEIIELLYTELC